MEFGLSSASFYPHVNTEESIKLMKSIGFNFGEIFFNSPSEYSKDFLIKLIEEKEKFDFKINSIHAFSSSFEPYLFDGYKRRRDDMFKEFKKVCKAGNMLGAKFYTFHGMRLTNMLNLDKKLIIDIYNKLIYTAKEIGITLAQENVSWCMSSNIEFLKYIEENCMYPINFTFDIKQAYKANMEPEQYIKTMGKNIVNFHINDRNKENDCLLPGQGEVDYNKLFNNLRKVGYNGIGIVEVYSKNYRNYDDIINCRKFLEKL